VPRTRPITATLSFARAVEMAAVEWRAAQVVTFSDVVIHRQEEPPQDCERSLGPDRCGWVTAHTPHCERWPRNGEG
jgi:hypothetical protein